MQLGLATVWALGNYSIKLFRILFGEKVLHIYKFTKKLRKIRIFRLLQTANGIYYIGETYLA